MKSINLTKIDYKNYEKIENSTCEYESIDFNLRRSWNFLQQTHELDGSNYLCIRTLCTATNKNDKYARNMELIIKDFSEDSFKLYCKFIKPKLNGKRIYNFFYNIYQMNIYKYKDLVKEKLSEGDSVGFMGNGRDSSYTNILCADFDHTSHEDYLKIKEFFLNRGLETLDVMSGHGYHIIIRLSERCYDKELLLKWINILESYGLKPDHVCNDSSRVMRLPFFYNKKKDYTTYSMSEVISNEFNSQTYTIEEVFEKMGFDYNTYQLEEVYKKKAGRPKKTKKEIEIEYVEDVDLVSTYPMLEIDKLPLGIQKMLSGFRKGYSNYQVMTLTIYFKSFSYDIEEIKEILSICESINSNDWNSWDVEQEVERFYYSNIRLKKYDLIDLEEVFGELNLFDNTNMFKIPMGLMESNELKLYMYLLITDDVRKVDIKNDLGFSNNKIDRIIEKSSYLDYSDRRYTYKEFEIPKFFYVSRDYIEKVLKLDENEISIYNYLYFRLRLKKEITTSITSISKYTKLSEKTVKTTIKNLELKQLVNVTRHNYNINYDKKISNTYSLRTL